MSVTSDQIRAALAEISLPSGHRLIADDLVRALSVSGGAVKFVIEAPNAEAARAIAPHEPQITEALRRLPGVDDVQIIVTAHGGSAGGSGAAAGGAGQGGAQPPNLKIGRHPTPQAGPEQVSGIDRIIAVASGKGGVGKSTVSSNLAVALARQGRRVGLLDADILGPSQPRMMGATGRPRTVDGDRIAPLVAHGVTLMSIGLLVDPDKAVIWRGPMLMGALQQMIGQVNWGDLDVLIVDLPPGTGDVQLSLCQKAKLTGALIVSTPQDVALLDARKAIDMFGTLNTPILGLIENMASFVCPECGAESHPFGHGGVRDEAQRLDLPFLGALPLDLETRLAGDAGTPIAAQEGPMAEAYAALARRMIDGGMG